MPSPPLQRRRRPPSCRCPPVRSAAPHCCGRFRRPTCRHRCHHQLRPLTSHCRSAMLERGCACRAVTRHHQILTGHIIGGGKRQRHDGKARQDMKLDGDRTCRVGWAAQSQQRWLQSPATPRASCAAPPQQRCCRRPGRSIPSISCAPLSDMSTTMPAPLRHNRCEHGLRTAACSLVIRVYLRGLPWLEALCPQRVRATGGRQQGRGAGLGCRRRTGVLDEKNKQALCSICQLFDSGC